MVNMPFPAAGQIELTADLQGTRRLAKPERWLFPFLTGTTCRDDEDSSGWVDELGATDATTRSAAAAAVSAPDADAAEAHGASSVADTLTSIRLYPAPPGALVAERPADPIPPLGMVAPRRAGGALHV